MDKLLGVIAMIAGNDAGAMALLLSKRTP